MAPIILTRLFNRSLEISTFPSIWKCGKETALFKGGDRTDCNNYRPITVIPTFSKILERAVHQQQLYEFLSANELLTPNRFGFLPKLSTVTALAHFTDNILLSLEKGGFTGAVFLDLSKAFTQSTMCFLSKNSRPLELALKFEVVCLIPWKSVSSHICWKLPVHSTKGSRYSIPRKHPWASSFSNIR